jgi:hypothetical protein
MIQTSDWRVEPSTQLALTLRVLATTRAISTADAHRALEAGKVVGKAVLTME